MARANSSLPVPLSPRNSTVELDGATMEMVSITRRTDGLSPTMPPMLTRTRAGLGFSSSAFSRRGPLVDQALAVGGDDAVETHCLPHEIGDHGEEAKVFIDADVGRPIPDAIDAERADHLDVVLDRHADERNAIGIVSGRRVGEQRIGGRILNDERSLRGDDAIDNRLRQAVDRSALHLAGPAGSGDDFRLAGLVDGRRSCRAAWRGRR